MNSKLEHFRATLEAATRARYTADWERDQARFKAGHPLGYNYPLSIHEPQIVCSIKMGRKYANVDRGTSGCYMVELDTGAIYGIKGYGVIHRGHSYGTLDTLADWDWSGYQARKVAA